MLLHFALAGGSGLTPIETDSSGIGAVVLGGLLVGLIFLFSGGGKGGGRGGGKGGRR